MEKLISLASKGSGPSPTAALFSSLSEPLQISQLEGGSHHSPELRGEIQPSRGQLKPSALSPFIRPFQRTLARLPSSSPPLNGGKGYKVSPQRPIQSTVYSGNLTPAGVSASASDCYSAVGEKESERLEVRGKPIGPGFSERTPRTPWGPGGRSGGTQSRAKFKCISETHGST